MATGCIVSKQVDIKVDNPSSTCQVKRFLACVFDAYLLCHFGRQVQTSEHSPVDRWHENCRDHHHLPPAICHQTRCMPGGFTFDRSSADVRDRVAVGQIRYRCTITR